MLSDIEQSYGCSIFFVVQMLVPCFDITFCKEQIGLCFVYLLLYDKQSFCDEKDLFETGSDKSRFLCCQHVGCINSCGNVCQIGAGCSRGRWRETWWMGKSMEIIFFIKDTD